jgi:circadian clock protein KaiC
MSVRVATGSAEADQVLGGGFLKNSINILMGQPGTGKTVFAEQLVFRNAGEGRPILYLTTLSEPLAKVVKYLQRFDFFDATKLGTAVHYEDVGPALAKEGIGALLEAIQAAIRTVAPRIIVVDSFKALHDLSSSASEMRKMLYELTGTLTAYDTTVFLVGEYSEEHVRQLPEFAIADGIVQFLRSPTSRRDERFLRVLKLRGSAYAEGQHGFRITQGGLQVFPRLVSPEVPETYRTVQERVPTGVPGLDEAMGGGVWRGSTTLLAGPTGAGKTTIGLQFALEGVKRGEPSLFVNFQENPTQLAGALRSLGTDVAAARRRGLHLSYSSPVELQIDSVIVSLFRTVREHAIQRVVVDSVADLMSAASDPQRLQEYLYAFVQHLAVLGVTCVLTFETPGGVANLTADASTRLSYMSDNIVLLGVPGPESPARSLTVLKARASAHALDARELSISAAGVSVRPRPARP